MVKIKKIYGDELLQRAILANYAFSRSPADVEKKFEEGKKYYSEDIVLAAIENDKTAATATIVPMRQNIRGKVMRMGGVAAVATDPEFRMQGIAKSLMKEAFLEMKEAEFPISTLYPFRESFYERLGYAVFPQASKISFSPNNISLRKKPRGEIVREKISDCLDRFISFNKKYVERVHSAAIFQDLRMGSFVDPPVWIAWAMVDGEAQGLIGYTITGFEGTLEVKDFMYLTSEAKYTLLEFLGRHRDQVSNIEMVVQHHEHPELWLSDLKVSRANRKWVPSPMGRIVDMEQLNGVPAGKGRIEVQVVDEHAPWNNGRFVIESDGELNVEKGGNGNLKLSINALSALLFGQANPLDFDLKGWGKVSPIESKQILKLFPPLPAFVDKYF